MVKIQSQAGDSLADVYDVRGSIAGIDHLETRELGIIHEMGGTVFSERFSMRVIRVNIGARAQNIDFTAAVTLEAPVTPTRILGTCVFCDAGARIAKVALLARSETDSREFPIWVYDGSNFIEVDMEDSGLGLGSFDVLQGEPSLSMLPSFASGLNQPQMVETLQARGRTTAFGAGTVTPVCLWLVAFSRLEGLSSRGLPIPSW